MNHYYSIEKNTQMLLSLLKKHNIKRIVASPGGTNIAFVVSAQYDPYFEIYSCIDERSAAYMACGIASETGEPVVISCTGATASRNYMPALTEAFYRKLPILAVTSSRAEQQLYQLRPQITNRSVLPTDVVKEHVVAPFVTDENTMKLCRIAINKAIIALTKGAGGPVHIDLHTLASTDFSVKELPDIQAIKLVNHDDIFPELPEGDIAIFIGSHKRFSEDETNNIDMFCENHNAVVISDHTSNYYGKYSLPTALILAQNGYNGRLRKVRLLIHIGEISGDYYSMNIQPQEVWRVHNDGEVQDLFGTLSKVFMMPSDNFWKHYVCDRQSSNDFFIEIADMYNQLTKDIPEIPYSNAWIAKQLSPQVPAESVIHFGILNSLRCWNFFRLPNGVRSECNVGGFGIDGTLSTLIGASLANPRTNYFAVLGDLSFFYDLNALGNRHIGNNVRILLMNNGLGQEFKNPGYVNNYHLGELTDKYISAAGHYSCQSKELIKHFAEALGFTYLCASTKDEFNSTISPFLSEKISEKPMLFEVFLQTEEETEALTKLLSIIPNSVSNSVKNKLKHHISQDKISALKTLLS